MSVNGWMDKENVAYTYNGMLFSLRKEEKSAICDSMDAIWGYYAKWNKPDIERQLLHDSTCMKYLR